MMKYAVLIMVLLFGLQETSAKESNQNFSTHSETRSHLPVTDTLNGKIKTVLSFGYQLRASTLQKLLEDCSNYYEKQFPSINFTVKLMVLDATDWQNHKITLPYGVPASINDQDLILAAAEKKAVAALVGQTDDLPDDHLSDFDYITLHELGHNFFAVQQKIKIPERWADEFLATYFATCYLMDIGSEKMLPRADFPGYQPKYKSLEDFDRYYFGVGPQNYGWYQDQFQNLANLLYPKYKTELLRKFIENYSSTSEPVSALDLLKKLEPELIGQWLQER